MTRNQNGDLVVHIRTNQAGDEFRNPKLREGEIQIEALFARLSVWVNPTLYTGAPQKPEGSVSVCARSALPGESASVHTPLVAAELDAFIDLLIGARGELQKRNEDPYWGPELGISDVDIRP